jgi:hypothetical protein
MSFLSQIQQVLERTYAPVGVNLEDCLIGRKRCEELSDMAGKLTEDMSWNGRTFFRVIQGKLRVGIYYHPSIIDVLENYPPTRILNHKNIHALIVFLEELDHAVHAGLKFSEDQEILDDETMPNDLELQGKVDAYLTLQLLANRLQGGMIHTGVKAWLREMLFESESFDYRNSSLRNRYAEANRLGYRLVNHLDSLQNPSRIEYLRRFRTLTFEGKRAQIEALVLAS